MRGLRLVLTVRLGNDHEPLGTSWVDNFLNPPQDELQTHWSKPLVTQRARALNPTHVALWFDLVKRHIIDKDILLHAIYGMDKSGFPPSIQGTSLVSGCCGTKTQHKQGSANQENVTCVFYMYLRLFCLGYLLVIAMSLACWSWSSYQMQLFSLKMIVFDSVSHV